MSRMWRIVMKVKLSFFSVQDGNCMTLEEKIHQLVLENIWPIILTSEQDVELETCDNELELRSALQRQGIL